MNFDVTYKRVVIIFHSAIVNERLISDFCNLQLHIQCNYTWTTLILILKNYFNINMNAKIIPKRYNFTNALSLAFCIIQSIQQFMYAFDSLIPIFDFSRWRFHASESSLRKYPSIDLDMKQKRHLKFTESICTPKSVWKSSHLMIRR